MTAAVTDEEPADTPDDTESGSAGGGFGFIRWFLQPLVCVAAVAGCLIYVKLADVTPSEQRSLGVPNLLELLGQPDVVGDLLRILQSHGLGN